MPNQYDVICVGILVADILSSPIPRAPEEGELILAGDIALETGGCATNTGVDLVKLGGRVGLIGKVGNDIFGEFIIREMKAKGLETRGIKISPSAPTSKTMIINVISQDRRFIHTLGANGELSYEDIDLDMIAVAKILYVGGYLVIPKLDQKALTKIFQFARGKGLKTVLDVVVPAEAGEEYRAENTLAQLLPYTNVFVPNDDEARLLTGKEELKNQAEVFLNYGCETVVITRGEKGAFLKTKKETISSPAFKIEVVDPSGAGDAFDAGLIMGMLQNWAWPRTLEFASAVGASACTKLGCTPGVFTMAETKKFLNENKLSPPMLK